MQSHFESYRIIYKAPVYEPPKLKRWKAKCQITIMLLALFDGLYFNEDPHGIKVANDSEIYNLIPLFL